jgi:carbonic anhydrase
VRSESNFAPLLGRNERFAATDAKLRVPQIPFIPLRQLYIITCIDPRVEPGAVLGVELGEAIIARNVGGRITPPVVKDLAWIVHLHEQLTPEADWFEIAVMHHTECGSGLLARDDLRTGYVARGGWDDETSRQLAVIDPHETVAEDVGRLRAAPELIPAMDRIRVGGYSYDLHTGVVTTVVAPA